MIRICSSVRNIQHNEHRKMFQDVLSDLVFWCFFCSFPFTRLKTYNPWYSKFLWSGILRQHLMSPAVIKMKQGDYYQLYRQLIAYELVYGRVTCYEVDVFTDFENFNCDGSLVVHDPNAPQAYQSFFSGLAPQPICCCVQPRCGV